MLIDLRDYMRDKVQANLQELCWHFQQPPEVVRAWLAHWVSKGKISLVEQPLECGSVCQMCQAEVAEIYRWSPPCA